MDVVARRRVPLFRVETESDSTSVWVLLTYEAVVFLETSLGIKDAAEPEHIDRLLSRYGTQVIEQRIRSGTLDDLPRPRDGVPEITLHGSDVGMLLSFEGAKVCGYQKTEGRDLFCSAADEDDETATRVGLRHFAPTSKPLCAKCKLPDTRFICSHLHHPVVRGFRIKSTAQRQLKGAFCDEDRPEIADASRCYPGGNPCWTLLVEPAAREAPFVVPDALPHALDHFDTAWRLAFQGSRLLNVRSVADAASLTLPAASADEVKGRLSALDDVLKSLRIPDELLDQSDRGIPRAESFNRLEAVLRAQLPEDFPEAREAIATLRAANRIRVGFQHSGAAPEASGSFAQLGIRYPTTDWSDAWDRIRAQVVQALDALTDVLRRLAIGDE